MRIEPVYLVAPAKQKPPALSRRAFLLAGCAFAIGLGSGGACGYALGARKAAEPAANEPDASPQLPPPSGDAELDELRRLAVVAPIEELVAQQLVFLSLVADSYRRDETLWKGVERLCHEVLTNGRYPDRRLAAARLAQFVELGEQGLRQRLLPKVRLLRAVR